MKKKKITFYYLLGTVLMIVLCGVCTIFFVKNNLEQIEDKNRFESIYTETYIDFIVPGPSDSQVSELEKENNGIEVMTPYYETATSLLLNGTNTRNGTAILFPNVNKMENTPYNGNRIIKGDKKTDSGCAIADKTYSVNTGCKIGDKVSITIADKQLSFTITGIAEDNTYYNEGSIALILSEADAKHLQDSGIKYSSAYVKASDIVLCEKYLKNDYKPMSRLKDETEFDSSEIYNKHVKNFNETDWSKEITNSQANYDSLSIKYSNTDRNIWINIAIMTSIIVIIIIIFNCILLTNDNMKKYIKTFLVKKSGTKDDVKAFYKSGIIYNAILFLLLSVGGYVYMTYTIGLEYIGKQALNCAIPVGAAILISLIMIGVCMNYVEKHYKIKIVKRKDAPEEIQVEIV